MKAIVCNAYGAIDDLALSDMPDPVPGPDDIVLDARAIGVNYPDGLLVQGLYQMKPALPFIPGMEAAGIVSAIGENVTHLKPGDRAAVLLNHGAYCTKVPAPGTRAFPLPDAISDDAACALLCAWGTAHHALKQRGNLKAGETLVVTGAAGSTGIAAIQIGKAMGARVIAVASTAEKQAIAKNSGADAVTGYEDLRGSLKQLTGGKGADVVFDSVGGDGFEPLARSMARGGRLLVIGFASGTIPALPANLVLLKESSVVGVFWGAFIAAEPHVYAENNRELFTWAATGKVKPVIGERVPLEQAPGALKRILNRETTGKTILVP